MMPHDLHVHTPLSGCGRVTFSAIKRVLKSLENEGESDITRNSLLKALVKEVVREYVSVARIRGVKLIGFTDHFNLDTSPRIFGVLRDIVKDTNASNVKLLVATEADILDDRGLTTVTKEVAETLDYVISGQHHYHLSYVKKPPREIEDFLKYALRELENTLKNPVIDAIGHPWLRAISFARKRYGLNLSLKDVPEEHVYRICDLAEKYGKAIQVEYNPNWESRGHPLKGILRLLKIVAESDCMIFYGSDAHRPVDLARDFTYTAKVLEEMGVNSRRIWLPREK